MKSTKIPAILITLGFATAVTTAQTTSISVENHSFESPDISGNTLGPTPTGWTSVTYTIDKAHTNITIDDPLDGTDQFAMLRLITTGYQVLGEAIQPNTTYTLTIDVGPRPGKLFTAGNLVDIRLGTGSVPGADLLTADSANTPIPAGSAWETWTKTFTTGDTVSGDPLRIELFLGNNVADAETGALQDPQPCFDNVRLEAAPAATRRFQLIITPATAPDTGFDLEWDSQAGMLYNLRTSTDLAAPISTWNFVEGDIAATPPTNLFNVNPADSRRFYAVEEFIAPPLFAADFEGNDGGFTQVTDAGTAWERGAPDSSGLGGVVNAGNSGSAECWGTGIGSPGFYANPTTNSRLISPVIDLTLVSAAELSFAQAMDVQANDSAVVRLYNADTNAEITFGDFPLTVIDPNTNEAPWTASGPHALPVGASIRIEWILDGTGGTSQDYMGWYIDDVRVEETTP